MRKKLFYLLLFCLFVTSAIAQLPAGFPHISPPFPIAFPQYTNIVDSSGNVWTVSGGVVLENGSDAGYSASVIDLAYVDKIIYQENSSGGWWYWNGTTWISTTNPTPGSGPTIASITASPGSGTITTGNVTFTVNFSTPVVVGTGGGTPTLNLNTATPSAASYTSGSGTKSLVFTTALSSGETANPVATTSSAISLNGGIIQTNGNNAVLTGANSTTFTGLIFAPSGSGTFSVSGGQIIGPNGQPFIAKGVNVLDNIMSTVSTSSSAAPLTTLFPGINFVRLACESAGTGNFSADDVAALTTFVNQLTGQGIVVEIEDHDNYNSIYTSAGRYSQGGDGTSGLDTSVTLGDVTAWYASLATAFLGNPYVWFGDINEPGGMNYPVSDDVPSPAVSSSVQSLAIYNAIRGTGNNTIFLLQAYAGGESPSGNNSVWPYGTSYTDSNYIGTLIASDYSSMTNVAWDMHWYSNAAGGGSTNQTTMNAALASYVALLQTSSGIISVNGKIPVMNAEMGNSAAGNNGGSGDANGVQVVAAALQGPSAGVTFGYAAWTFYWPYSTGIADNLVDQNASPLALTSYGSQVAAGIE